MNPDIDPIETKEWLDAFASVLKYEGAERAQFILQKMQEKAGGKITGQAINTPYINTIPVEQQPKYPGDLALEAQIEAIHRWNAIAMVLKAKKEAGGVGGHLSSYASIATLYEVGLNHFFKAGSDKQPGDLVYFQGHSSEGLYARAFLEGRLSAKQLEHFVKK